MGPTLQSPPISLDCSSKNVNVSTVNFSVAHNCGEMRKLLIPVSNIDKVATEIKYLVTTSSKLAKCSTKVFIRHENIGFEGPQADEYNKMIGISEAHNSQDENALESKEKNFLRIFSEQYNFQSLKNWLEDRDNYFLHIFQVRHIISQLILVLKGLIEMGITDFLKEITIDCVHVVYNDNLIFVEDYLPTLKLQLVDVENIFEETPLQKTCKIESFLEFVAHLWLQLLQQSRQTHRKSKETTNDASIDSEFPEEVQIIQEILNFNENRINFSETDLSDFITKVLKICQFNSEPILFNVLPVPKRFLEMQEEVDNIEKFMMEDNREYDSNIIAIAGPSGSGKSVLTSLLSASSMSRNFNILRFNAATVDVLTCGMCHCAFSSKLRINTKDYAGNPKLRKSIFQEILRFFNDKRLLIILEDLQESTAEILELLQEFNENIKCDKSLISTHFMILTMEKSWNGLNTVLGACKTVQVQGFDNETSRQYLEMDSSMLESERVKVCALLAHEENLPATMNLITSFQNNSHLENHANFLESIQTFEDLYTMDSSKPSSLTLSSVYLMSCYRIYESLTDESEKLAFKEVLCLLSNIDGNCGMDLGTFVDILGNFSSTTDLLVSASTFSSMLKSLHEYSLIEINDRIIRLQSWMQISLRTSLQFVINQEAFSLYNFQKQLLSTLKSIISSSSEPKWKLIQNIMNVWVSLCRQDLSLASEFDCIPEMIVNLARRDDKLEFIVGFLKQAVDILTLAYKSPLDYRVLKLNFIWAKDYLLCQSKTNEAFIVFKLIHENCRTDPREFLMLKLKSLIELGQIHISKGQYDKALATLQQVQVFSVQKIPTIELDSVPTVLKSRMLFGYTHLQRGDLEEGKRILLQVIPLLEKYEGPDKKETRRVLNQARFYLAVLLRQNGDLVNALMIQKKVMKEREESFGRKHPETWASKRELALLYSAYDNHERALIILRNLLEVQEEVLGAPSDRQSLATMNAIAEIEAKLGNFDDALELYEAIDLIEQQVLPETDEMRISSQLNQAEVLMSLGQYKVATDIFDLIYALKTTSENKSAQDVLLCESILKKREKAGRSMEILGNYWLSLTPENVDDPSDLSALAKKHEVATELSENQDYHGALRFLREVLEDCGHLDETNRFHLNVKADMARVLGLVGKFNESFSVFKEIIPLMDATFGETDELTMLCKDTMGQVFLFSGNQFLKRQMSNLKWFLF